MCHEIEFVNRNYELDEICRPVGPKFVLVDAPAGYGKSFLLRKVKETFEEREDWAIVLVNLKSQRDMSSDRVEQACAAIANEIAKQVGKGEIVNPSMQKDRIASEMNKILQPLAQKILLLFDDTQVLSPDASNWLLSVISKLDHALRTARKELRVVLAGRYARDWSRRARFGIRLLELSPFDLEVIRPIVHGALERSPLAVRDIDQAFVDALVWYTHWISGGHPQGIGGIVSRIESLNAVPLDLQDFFFSDVFQEDGRSGTMFDLYTEPIVEAIVGSLTVRDALETVSIFRKFNPDILDILISDEEIQGFESGWKLLQELLKTHLVDTPNLANPMYSDEIVRRMLDIRMRISEPDRYERLNRRAKEIFRTWALGDKLQGIPKRGELDTHVRLISIVESLYHTLSLMQHTVSLIGLEKVQIEQSNESELKKELRLYLKAIGDRVTVDRLRATLLGDQELLELIRSRAGEEGCSRLLNTIEDFLP